MTPEPAPSPAATARLPLSGLLALAMAGFVTILTEALPAGLLPQIGRGLGVSDAFAGQTVTIYAIGSLLAAMPLTAATQGIRRRPLLLAAIAGFAVANSVTALSPFYWLTMAARFGAGVAAGLLWALLAGYAARMVPAALKGRAIAVAMVGTPLALSLGIPAGTFLGSVLGWRLCFGMMSLLTLALIVWVVTRVPDFAGEAQDRRHTLREVVLRPGVRPVLLVTLGFVLPHNILYTYVAPFLAAAGMAAQTGLVLLVFGGTALASIWIVGLLIDRHLRRLTLASIALFGAVAVLLAIGGRAPHILWMAAAIWGLSFGGVATLLQTALSDAAGDAPDMAQSMLVTAWNLAIAGGGVAGGVILQNAGTGGFAPAMLALLLPTLALAVASRRHGFPPVSHH